MEFRPQIKQPEQIMEYKGRNLRSLYELTKKVFPAMVLSEAEFVIDFEVALQAIEIDPLDGGIDYAAYKNFRAGVKSDDEVDAITNPQILLAAALFKALKNPEIIDISGELVFNTITGQTYVIDHDGVWSDNFEEGGRVLLVPSPSTRFKIGTEKKPLDDDY